MLNFIGIVARQLLYAVLLQDPGRSDHADRRDRQRRAHTAHQPVPTFRAAGFVPLSVAFLLAILMCVLVYVFLWKTKWGYELRAVGENPSAAEYGGISPKKQIIIAMTHLGRRWPEWSRSARCLGNAVQLLRRVLGRMGISGHRRRPARPQSSAGHIYRGDILCAF